MWGCWATSGLVLVALGLSAVLWLLVAFAVVCAFLLEYGNVLWTPLMQEYVPARLLGRVSALDWLFSFSLTPLGIAAAGPLADAFGPRATMVAGGTLAACLVVVLLVPGVRDPDRVRAD
jgi:sugar phosphate permease